MQDTILKQLKEIQEKGLSHNNLSSVEDIKEYGVSMHTFILEVIEKENPELLEKISKHLGELISNHDNKAA